MSCCSIVTFKDGRADKTEDFSNSWGGCPRIWDALFNKYLKNPLIPYDSWMARAEGGDRSLWDLAKRDDIPLFERAVHASTFDYFIVRKENFDRFSRHLMEFVAAHPLEEEVVDHLPSWAEFVKNCELEAIGFHGTSVSDNPWRLWDEGKEEHVPFDLATGEHEEVYEWLEKEEK